MGIAASKAPAGAPLLQPSMEGDLDRIKELVGEFIASYTPASSSATASDPIDPELRAYADRTDGQGNAAVHGAAFGGHLETVRFLAETCGADLHKRNGLGCTPLWLAAGYGHDGVLSYLIERVGRVSALLLTPQDVLLAENGTGDTPLLAAASRGHVESCCLLLEAVDGCDGASGRDGLRKTNAGGDTPLHVAVGAGHDGPLLDLFLDWDAREEPEGGADAAAEDSVLNLKNGQGLTPLLVACERNHAGIAKTLVERGALPIPDKNGATPLAVAAFCGCEDVVAALLETELGRELLDVPDVAGGCTPLWLAARTGNAKMVRLLMDAGADATIRNKEGLTAEDAATKYEKKAVMELFGYDIREVKVAGDD